MSYIEHELSIRHAQLADIEQVQGLVVKMALAFIAYDLIPRTIIKIGASGERLSLRCQNNHPTLRLFVELLK